MYVIIQIKYIKVVIGNKEHKKERKLEFRFHSTSSYESNAGLHAQTYMEIDFPNYQARLNDLKNIKTNL